jgi:hypothetical protein
MERPGADRIILLFFHEVVPFESWLLAFTIVLRSFAVTLSKRKISSESVRLPALLHQQVLGGLNGI